MKFIPVLKDTTDQYRLIALCAALTAGCFLRALFSNTPQGFGRDTLYIIRQRISSFLEFIDLHGSSAFALDSGGYDLAIGKIHPFDFSKLLDCVLKAGRALGKKANMLFTLDVQHFLAYPQKNTIEDIYSYNKLSISATVEQIEDIPELRSKYFLVWQGRNLEQYNLWLRLMSETRAEEIFLHHSVGGMVKISDVIDDTTHSPFIGLAFRCFQSIYNYPSINNPERGIHLLGVQNRRDRFVSIILEHLFSAYIERAGRQGRISISCDSATPLMQATYRCRELCVPIYDQGVMNKVFIGDLPESIVRKAYPVKRALDLFYENIEMLKDGKPLLLSNFCVPVAVYGLVQENKFMEDIVKSFEVVDLFWKCSEQRSFQVAIKEVYRAITFDHPGFFSPATTMHIKESLSRIFKLHQAVVEDLGARQLSIDSEVFSFIDELGIPSFYN